MKLDEDKYREAVSDDMADAHNHSRYTTVDTESSRKLTVIEGRNPVIEALKAGRPIKVILVASNAHGKVIEDIKTIAKSRAVQVKEVDSSQLDRNSHTGFHQGVMAYATPYTYVDVEDILAIAREKDEQPLILLLDELNDPHNLGAIIRTAEGMGAHGVVITKNRSVEITPAVARASAGAIEYMPVAAVTNMVQTIEFLKKAGLWIVGADMDGKPCWSVDLKGPLGLVIGSEGKGIRRLVKEHCDLLTSIPLKGYISSLNASAAAAMLIYEIIRQRLDMI